MRRRQHLKAALAATAAVVVCGAFLGLPGESWGPDGAAAPPYARNPAAQAALDPGRLTTATATAWQTTGRSDFTTWPARGDLVKDKALLRRALAVWARPGESVQVAVTLGTQAGPPPGPPQLLYAGRVDNLRVVLLHDGLRIARYAEPLDDPGVAALDLTRVDGATGSRRERPGAGPGGRQRPLSDGPVGARGGRTGSGEARRGGAQARADEGRDDGPVHAARRCAPGSAGRGTSCS